MPSLLYFHGFASSPDSTKLTILRQRLEPSGYQFNTPDLNVPSFRYLDWEAMVETGAAQLESEPDLIVGSSLGALLALDLCSRHEIALPMVLVSPVLGFRDRWSELIPEDDPIMVPNHASGHEEPIHRAFFESDAMRHADRPAPNGPVSVLAGTSDESVPFDGVQKTWRAWLASGQLTSGSRLVEIAGADHSLLDWLHVIESEIVLRANEE